MRWGDGDLKLPTDCLAGSFIGRCRTAPNVVMVPETIRSDRTTSGTSVLHPEPVTIAHAENYVTSLRSAFVGSSDQRQAKIQEQVRSTAQQLESCCYISRIVREVTNLIRMAFSCCGKFEPEFLSLPPEVITGAM